MNPNRVTFAVACVLTLTASYAAPALPVEGGLSGRLAPLGESLKKGKAAFQADLTSTLERSRSEAHELIDRIVDEGDLESFLQAMGSEEGADDLAAQLRAAGPDQARTLLHSRLERKLSSMGQEIQTTLAQEDEGRLQASYDLAYSDLAREETNLIETMSDEDVPAAPVDSETMPAAPMASEGMPAAPGDRRNDRSNRGQSNRRNDRSNRGQSNRNNDRRSSPPARRTVQRQQNVIQQQQQQVRQQQRVISQQSRQLQQTQRQQQRQTLQQRQMIAQQQRVRQQQATLQRQRMNLAAQQAAQQSYYYQRNRAVAAQNVAYQQNLSYQQSLAYQNQQRIAQQRARQAQRQAWLAQQAQAQAWAARASRFDRYVYGRGARLQSPVFPAGYYYRPDRVEKVIKRGLWGVATVAATPFALLAAIF